MKAKKQENNVDNEWTQFTAALADTLADLRQNESLVISATRTDHFVQFAAQGRDGMRAEAQSNQFIEEKKNKLSEATQERMLNLGWNAPTYELSEVSSEPPEGSCNYYMDFAVPVPFKKIAELAVTTLREVYRVKRRDALMYDVSNEDGYAIRYPSLAIRSVA